MAGFGKYIFVYAPGEQLDTANDIIIGYDGLELVDMGHNIYQIDGIEFLRFEEAIACLCELRNESLKPTDKYLQLIGESKVLRGM